MKSSSNVDHDNKNYIRWLEKKRNREPPRAPLDSDFEEYFLPTERMSIDLPEEENTELEDEMFMFLRKHFKGGFVSRKDLQPLLEQARKGYHKDVISLIQSKKIYRGMAVSVSFEKNARNSMADHRQYVYAPTDDKIISWSTDLIIAEDFAGKGLAAGREVPIILVARVEDNDKNDLLQIMPGMYDMFDFEKYVHEKEVLSFSDEIVVFEIRFT